MPKKKTMINCYDCGKHINTIKDEYAARWIVKNGGPWISFLCIKCSEDPKYKEINLDETRESLGSNPTDNGDSTSGTP